MREKEIIKIMPKWYRWNAYNSAAFFWIKAQLQLFPTMTLDQAISNFYKYTGIDEGEWDRMAIRMQYNRMQHEFYGKTNDCTKKDKRDTGPKAGPDKQKHGDS